MYGFCAVTTYSHDNMFSLCLQGGEGSVRTFYGEYSPKLRLFTANIRQNRDFLRRIRGRGTVCLVSKNFTLKMYTFIILYDRVMRMGKEFWVNKKSHTTSCHLLYYVSCLLFHILYTLPDSLYL